MSVLPPPPAPVFDRAKFKALVHYVCYKAPNPKKLGATKLNKILFYADMEAYLQRGRPISGEIYVKRQHGPAPRHVQEVLEELKAEQAILISEASGYGIYTGQYRQRRFYPVRKPDLSIFDGLEVELVDEIIHVICERHTARSISERSHDVVWESAEMGEEIPYYTAYAQFLRPVNDEVRAWAQARITGEV